MSHKSEVTLQVGGGGGTAIQPVKQSSSVVTTSGSSSQTMTQSFSGSSNTSSSKTSSTSSTSSTTTKKTMSTKTTSKTMSSKQTFKSSSVSIKSSSESYKDHYSKMLGVNADEEMKMLQSSMDVEMGKIRQDLFKLTTLEKAGTGHELVKLDSTSIMDYVDKDHSDKLKFQFDVDEFESESINVKTVGNQVEVHGVRKVKVGDQEHTEEYSRSYEMPTAKAIEPSKVSTSIYKDGVLTIELPLDSATV